MNLPDFVKKYIAKLDKEPEYLEKITLEEKEKLVEKKNVLYKLNDDYYVHIFEDKNKKMRYNVIKREIKDKKAYKYIKEKVLESIVANGFLRKKKELKKIIDEQIKYYQIRFFKKLEEEEKKALETKLKEEFLYLDAITPLTLDENIEDITAVNYKEIWIYHKIYSYLKTNVKFEDELHIESFVYKVTEIEGKPASESNPIVDISLKDGSRFNVIFGKGISKRGTSFTIRKFAKEPMSITQIIKLNTLSSEEAAYLWLLLENNLSIMVCGETASGKTTLLNALLAFVDKRAKIFSVEDTPEIYVPHENWQRTIAGPTATMFDLIEIGIQMRPDFIIVGEFRGNEGYAAFQAMQAGYGVLATFHAGNMNSLVQRLSGNPINIPKDYIPNLGAVVFQQTVVKNKIIVRRNRAIYEVLDYDSKEDLIKDVEIFSWNSSKDYYRFVGLYNSYNLEVEIAEKKGIERKEVYEILKERAKFLEELVKKKVFKYKDVFEAIHSYEGP